MTKRQFVQGIAFEMKADTETGTIEGYGSVFGTKDQGGDIVASGAFNESLASNMPKMLWQHDPSEPIGVWDEAKEDGKGLLLKGRILTDTTKGRDVMAFARAGAVDGLSIGYQCSSASVDPDTKIRTIEKANLWEVSVVTFPMHLETRIHAAKSTDEIDAMTESEIERRLREASDLSRSEVKRIIHRLMSVGAQRKAAEFEDAELTRVVRDMRNSLRV